MDTVFYILAGPLFLISVVGYAVIRLRLRPRFDRDLDDYYHEFEEQHPEYGRYLKWSRTALAGVVLAMLLLFLAMVF